MWAQLLVVLYVATLVLAWRNEHRGTWHVGDRGSRRDRGARRDADDGGDGGQQQQRPPVLRLAALSLPEVSTVFGTLLTRSYGMAVASVAATNALEVALLAVADGAYREGAYRYGGGLAVVAAMGMGLASGRARFRASGK